jgi:bifunctional non-homologous end joining protein LigD
MFAAVHAVTFHALQNALSTGKKEDLQFWVFDLLFIDGEDVRGKPLLERKALLHELLKKPPKRIHYSDHFEARREAAASSLFRLAGGHHFQTGRRRLPLRSR